MWGLAASNLPHVRTQWGHQGDPEVCGRKGKAHSSLLHGRNFGNLSYYWLSKLSEGPLMIFGSKVWEIFWTQPFGVGQIECRYISLMKMHDGSYLGELYFSNFTSYWLSKLSEGPLMIFGSKVWEIFWTQPENFYSTGFTHEDCPMTMFIVQATYMFMYYFNLSSIVCTWISQWFLAKKKEKFHKN